MFGHFLENLGISFGNSLFVLAFQAFIPACFDIGYRRILGNYRHNNAGELGMFRRALPWARR